ncbi:MAG: hypothetical protein QXZ43_01630 [Candidatus Aenigmatarchaeota archaeon]
MKPLRRILLGLSALVLCSNLALSCGQVPLIPTSTPTLASTSTPTSTPSPTNTPTLASTSTPTSTPSPTNTPTLTPSSTPSPTNTPTLASTSTPTYTPTPQIKKNEKALLYSEPFVCPTIKYEDGKPVLVYKNGLPTSGQPVNGSIGDQNHIMLMEKGEIYRQSLIGVPIVLNTSKPVVVTRLFCIFTKTSTIPGYGCNFNGYFEKDGKYYTIIYTHLQSLREDLMKYTEIFEEWTGGKMDPNRRYFIFEKSGDRDYIIDKNGEKTGETIGDYIGKKQELPLIIVKPGEVIARGGYYDPDGWEQLDYRLFIIDEKPEIGYYSLGREIDKWKDCNGPCFEEYYNGLGKTYSCGKSNPITFPIVRSRCYDSEKGIWAWSSVPLDYPTMICGPRENKILPRE